MPLLTLASLNSDRRRRHAQDQAAAAVVRGPLPARHPQGRAAQQPAPRRRPAAGAHRIKGPRACVMRALACENNGCQPALMTKPNLSLCCHGRQPGCCWYEAHAHHICVQAPLPLPPSSRPCSRSTWAACARPRPQLPRCCCQTRLGMFGIFTQQGVFNRVAQRQRFGCHQFLSQQCLLSLTKSRLGASRSSQPARR